jgi:zinc protease
MRPGDARWQPINREQIAAATPEQFQQFFEPALSAGPVQAVIVGDVELEAAVKAMAATIGALPTRPQPPTPATEVVPPRPNPEPVRFTHRGDKDQAFALIGWSTFGGTGEIRDRRALSAAAEILGQRLFERLREEEGATYSPGASATSSRNFPSWGVFTVSAEIKPDAVDTFFRIAREEVAKLAAKPVAADEFDRARNPIVSGIERRLKTNGYWLSAMESWTTRPELIEQTRSYLSDYKALTAEDVRRAVAAHVTDEGDWSMLVLPDKAKDSGN